jgi:hypothetical protein
MVKKLVIRLWPLLLLLAVAAWDQPRPVGDGAKAAVNEAISQQIVDHQKDMMSYISGQQMPPHPTLTTRGYYVNIRSCPEVDNIACPPVTYLKSGDHAEVIGVDRETGWWKVNWQGQLGWITNASWLVQVTGEIEAVPVIDRAEPYPCTADMRVLFEEMTLVQVLSEEYARIESVCAGVGLTNIRPLPDGPMVLIPNAGDLAVNGSNVAIKLDPNGELTFIPRTQGQWIRVPVDIGDKVAGQEVPSLTFDEAMRLMAANHLVWTAKDQGPYGNGHGLPGHIAACDPRYPGPVEED